MPKAVTHQGDRQTDRLNPRKVWATYVSLVGYVAEPLTHLTTQLKTHKKRRIKRRFFNR